MAEFIQRVNFVLRHPRKAITGRSRREAQEQQAPDSSVLSVPGAAGAAAGGKLQEAVAPEAGNAEAAGRQPYRDTPLFDSAWYMSRYRDVPADPSLAREYYQTTGAYLGHVPHPAFKGIRFPARACIPEMLRHRATASPILARVPASRYLEEFRAKKELHKEYGTLNDYVRRSAVRPNVITQRLWENDIRIVSYMDNLRDHLVRRYAGRPQDDLVSIVMPTRNRAELIADAILSVQMQSYENWELVIVDDASDQNDARLIVNLFEDSRITFIRLDEQVGNGQARNAGLAAARGKVVAYLDDDDQWDPDHLLVLLNEMRERGARAAYGAQAVWEGFDEKSRLGREFRSIRFAPFNRSLLENANYISMISLIHERSLLDEVGPFDASLERFLDWDLFLRLSEVSFPSAVPCVTSHYFQRRAEASVSAPVDREVAIGALRSRLIGRAEWSMPYRTEDGREHVAFSVSALTRRVRSPRLRRPAEGPIPIVIPNHESPDELELCIRSIGEHTPVPYEIIVVDNGSGEETRARLRRFIAGVGTARLVDEDTDAGFSYAVNRGLQLVDGEAASPVMILNNDTLVTPGWLDELSHVLEKHEDVGMAVPRQVLPAGHKIIVPHVPAAFHTFECDINLSAHHVNVVDPLFDREDGLIELSYAPLFCGLIRRSVFQTIQGLDARNGPHYRSDWIFCDALRRLTGQRIVYTPHSKVYHLQGVATRARRGN